MSPNEGKRGRGGPDGAPREEKQAPNEPPGPTASFRVLVVEDVPVNRLLACRHLRGHGYETLEAENGEECVDAAMKAWREGNPPAVILMDMQMPVMDGYEATRRLRELGYDGAIVAFTAHAVGEERERCIEAGCDDVATKPMEPEGWLETIRRLARQPGPIE